MRGATIERDDSLTASKLGQTVSFALPSLTSSLSGGALSSSYIYMMIYYYIIILYNNVSLHFIVISMSYQTVEFNC